MIKDNAHYLQYSEAKNLDIKIRNAISICNKLKPGNTKSSNSSRLFKKLNSNRKVIRDLELPHYIVIYTVSKSIEKFYSIKLKRNKILTDITKDYC